MKRYIKILFIVAAVAVAVVACGYYAVRRVMLAPCVISAPIVQLRISATDSYADLKEKLRPHIKHAFAFDIYARHINLQNRFRAGNYRLHDFMTVIDVARMLKFGGEWPVNVVLNNVRTTEQLAAKVAGQIDVDSLMMLRALRDTVLRGEVGFERDSIIAMFIPDTYQMYWTSSPEDFVRRMRREYDRFWNAERMALLPRTGLSQYEVMTLASIVYEETKVREDMPLIAGVYLNRLRRGMPLQACPTVKFAMQRFDLQRVLKEHLRFRSPYNTYINKGMPPSPICMPSIAAIDAVLNYTESKYLYFCARAELDGRHNFSTTLAEHNRYARDYSRALDARNIK